MSTEHEDSKIIIGDNLNDTLDAVDAVEDRARLQVGATLINTFNFAIQVQAGRTNWTESDYHRFVRALLVLDAIGKEAILARKAKDLNAQPKEETHEQIQEPLSDLSNQTESEHEYTIKAMPVNSQANIPVFLKPTRENAISSLPVNNTIKSAGVIVDDKRMPRQ